MADVGHFVFCLLNSQEGKLQPGKQNIRIQHTKIYNKRMFYKLLSRVRVFFRLHGRPFCFLTFKWSRTHKPAWQTKYSDSAHQNL